MQLLEDGFVRDDSMDPRAPQELARGRKPVFNAEAVAMLARYGLAPGAAFGDTMHFDFIEGYNAVVAEGGRNAQVTFGPNGAELKKRQQR